MRKVWGEDLHDPLELGAERKRPSTMELGMRLGFGFVGHREV